jgi:peptidoglycan hydrolase CwlO-like protein
MNKTIFVVTVVGVIALAMIILTIVTSDVVADNKRDRANKVLDEHIKEDGKHGEKAQEIKNKLNDCAGNHHPCSN